MAQRRRRWANINQTLVQWLVFDGHGILRRQTTKVSAIPEAIISVDACSRMRILFFW